MADDIFSREEIVELFRQMTADQFKKRGGMLAFAKKHKMYAHVVSDLFLETKKQIRYQMLNYLGLEVVKAYRLKPNSKLRKKVKVYIE